MEQLDYLANEFSFGAAIQIFLVSLFFNAVLTLIRGTQADLLLRGVLVLVVAMLVIGRVLQLEFLMRTNNDIRIPLFLKFFQQSRSQKTGMPSNVNF